MSDLLREAHDLALEIAPELRQSPLYILPAGDYPLPQEIDAYAPAGIDAYWQGRLRSSGEWQGNGHLVVIGNQVLDMEREEVLGIVLHECCHLLPHREPMDCPVATREAIRAAFDHAVKLSTVDNPAPVVKPWGIWHRDDFIRRTLHLSYRSEHLAGEWVPLPCFRAAGRPFRLSLLSRYRRALGDEPEQLRDKTFSEIEQTPPPEAFVELWLADTKGRDQ